MLNSIITEFQKLKRYSIILIGLIGVACSPIISIVMQNIMSDDAKSILNRIDKKFGPHADIVQIQYTQNSDLAQALRGCFQRSYACGI